MADPRYTASGSFRVRPHRPWRTFAVATLLVIGLGVGGWTLYELGLRHGGYQAESARAAQAHLRIQLDELRSKVEELSRENTLLERAERIEREARSRLRGVISEREERIAELEKELAFYRNLVSPSKMEPGLHVRQARLRPVDGMPRVYTYEVVVSQVNDSDSYVSGRIDWRFEGRRGGESVTAGLDEWIIGDDADTQFRFKYFQRLSGRIRVPQGVEPIRVQLRVLPSGDRLEALEQSYSWDSLLSGGN